jgi:tight adherence protein C
MAEMDLLQFIPLNGNMVFLACVFLSAILFAYAIVSMTTSWFSVRRRATDKSGFAGSDLPVTANDKFFSSSDGRSLLDGLLPKNEKSKSELRQFMNLAGYYSPAAPAIFQLARIITGIALGMVAPFYVQMIFPEMTFPLVTAACVFVALLGYMLPRSLVSLQRDKLLEEHRIGFPDFLDLLVICVEAGVGVDSAIERISQELAKPYPSLSLNLRFMSAELRNGRSTRDALDNMAQRLGIEEARAFATLIQQSEELGSSLVQSLRVYSEEMRAKRYARAEEKAHALPVKMVVPLGFFCFPVVLGVTLFPIALKISETFV